MTTTQTTEYFATLHGHSYMNLITFRKSGDAVSTPVWFALENNKVYVLTGKNAGKIKRIRNNSRVQVQPANRNGKPLGSIVDAQARVMAESEEAIAKHALNMKYGLIKSVFDFFMALMNSQRDYIEISPAK